VRGIKRSIVAGLAAVTLSGGAALAQQPVQVTPQGVRIDFVDAELRLVLTGLAEAGRINLVFGELPSRRVTLRTNQPLRQDEILPLLRSLAASNGLAVSEEGGFLRLTATAGEEQVAAPRDSAASADVRLFVYRLRHARAARLAGTLQSLFGGRSAPGASETLRAPLSERLRQNQIAPFDTAAARPPVQVELGPVGQTSLPGRLRGEVQIVPDEATNSLLVRAVGDDWQIVRQAVQSLDLRPLQVLIEVTIAEVRRSSEMGVGVSGRVGRDSTASATLQGLSAGDLALRVMHVGRVGVDLALRAMASSGRVRVLSRPVILAQNNQEARILVGSERPFVQVFRSLPTDAAVRDQVVQYRDVGTSLSILPTINEDGYVNLQVVQEVSTATAETQFGAPVINTREASTYLFIRDGQTAVLGGLVEHQREQTRSGVPFLKDLPLLGALFGSWTNTTTASELFLFLTPHVVASDEDVDRLRRGLEDGAELMRQQLPPFAPLVPPARRDSIPPGPEPTRP